MTVTQTKPGRTRKRGPSRAPSSSRSVLLGAVAVGVVAVAAVLAIVLTGGDDPIARAPATSPVELTGAPLPRLESPATDAAVGAPAPTLVGQSPEGQTISVDPGHPKILLFLAHWCPVCQEEVRTVQRWLDEGRLPADVEFISVATGTDARRPNYPPAPWLAREGWTVPVILDDESSSAAAAFGLPAYPFWVFVDGNGTVVGRHVGALGAAELDQIVKQPSPGQRHAVPASGEAPQVGDLHPPPTVGPGDADGVETHLPRPES
jgi:cytochrome c biogenesis protein CcmG, thiol:disulfide interchange protein DsbE